MKKADDQVAVMCAAHERGDVEAVRQLLAAYPELEKMGPDDNHIPWLHWAAEHGQIAVIEFWLERGVDVNLGPPDVAEDDGLLTALHLAKDAATTRYLLSRGALVNAHHNDFGTPLHYAITRALEPSQRGRQRPVGACMDQIRALVEAGADLTLTNKEGKRFTPLAWAVQLRRKTAEALLRELGAPEKGRRAVTRTPKIKPLDLQQDFAAVYQYLTQGVRDFDSAPSNPLGGPGDVKILHLGFELEQAGWVVLVFDTRPNAQPDGEWTSKIEGREIKMPHWCQAAAASTEQHITLVMTDGSQATHPEGAELAVPVGEMLKAALLKARDSGLFAALPLARDCRLSIEHFDGAYGWLENLKL